MRLLNTRIMKLEHFMDDRKVAGKYAILSHTWGEEEVSFEEFDPQNSIQREGYRKIQGAVDQALKDDIDYIWCDTCCIDKRSSAELSEAINSMYRWYYNAKVCYAYLDDLDRESSQISDLESPENSDEESYQDSDDYTSRLRSCRWFTRGWTLQELIAPIEVMFFRADWTATFRKSEFAEYLALVTGIDEDILIDRTRLSNTSVAKRMSYASSRTTTRLEDQAYCLLGIFEVNMPLLYGEGSKAFQRLQEEIIRSWTRVDHSILLWDSQRGWAGRLLADSPHWFRTKYSYDADSDIVSWSLSQNETFEISNKGLRISAHVCATERSSLDFRPMDLNQALEGKHDLLMALNCSYGSHKDRPITLRLRRRPMIHSRAPFVSHDLSQQDSAVYDALPFRHSTISTGDMSKFSFMTLTIARSPYYNWPQDATIQLEWHSQILFLRELVAGITRQGSILKLHTTESNRGNKRRYYGVLSFEGIWPSPVIGELYLHLSVETFANEPPYFGTAISRSIDPSAMMTWFGSGSEVELEGKRLLVAEIGYVVLNGVVALNLAIFDMHQLTTESTDSKRRKHGAWPFSKRTVSFDSEMD